MSVVSHSNHNFHWGEEKKGGGKPFDCVTVQVLCLSVRGENKSIELQTAAPFSYTFVALQIPCLIKHERVPSKVVD